MKNRLKLWLFAVLLAAVLVIIPRHLRATTVQIIGTIVDAAGNPLNGSACFNLPVNATDTSTSRSISTAPVCFNVTNGQFPSYANITPNDVIQPLNTYYRTLVRDATGAQVYAANYVIPTGGGTFNIGVAVPTAILTANISYLTPASLNNNNVFSGMNTFSQPITSTVTTGTSPFNLSSTTQILNLNASLLVGATWASPAALGSTTPAAVTATSVTDTGLTANFSTVCTGAAGILITTSACGAIYNGQAPIFSSTVPAVGGTCGSGPSITGNNNAFIVTPGTGSPTQCNITFASPAFTNTPACAVTQYGNAASSLGFVSGTSNTVLQVTVSAGNVPKFAGLCF